MKNTVTRSRRGLAVGMTVLAAALGAPAVANAATPTTTTSASSTTTSTTTQVKNGWYWILPSGAILGSGTCPTGYHGVPSIIPNYDTTALYYAGGKYDLTWSQIQTMLAAGTITKSSDLLYEFNAGYETVDTQSTRAQLAGKLVEVDCVANGYEIGSGKNTGHDTDITKVAPGTSVTTTTPTVTLRFQVDRYMPATRAQARVVARLDDDRLLKYGEDFALIGHSRWAIVTVTVPAHASTATIMQAINKATSARVGDVHTTAKLATAVPGKAYVFAWQLGKGATTAKTFGVNHNISQHMFARS